jgi:hypothetical protein
MDGAGAVLKEINKVAITIAKAATAVLIFFIIIAF